MKCQSTHTVGLIIGNLQGIEKIFMHVELLLKFLLYFGLMYVENCLKCHTYCVCLTLFLVFFFCILRFSMLSIPSPSLFLICSFFQKGESHIPLLQGA